MRFASLKHVQQLYSHVHEGIHSVTGNMSNGPVWQNHSDHNNENCYYYYYYITNSKPRTWLTALQMGLFPRRYFGQWDSSRFTSQWHPGVHCRSPALAVSQVTGTQKAETFLKFSYVVFSWDRKANSLQHVDASSAFSPPSVSSPCSGPGILLCVSCPYSHQKQPWVWGWGRGTEGTDREILPQYFLPQLAF